MSSTRHSDDGMSRKISGSFSREGYVEIRRPILNVETYCEKLGDRSKTPRMRDKLAEKIKGHFSTCGPLYWLSALTSFIPVTKWLPKYKIKTDLVPDLLSGLTIGLMSVPQGMAYARLAGLKPVYGLYTNLVPTLVYVLLGTSKHAAIGAATVMSLLMGEIRYKVIPCEDCWRVAGNSTFNGTNATSTLQNLTPMELAHSTAFLVGILLFVMGLLRLDFITAYLSDQIVCGYTAGAAVHIVTAQLGSFFGVHIDKSTGVGKIIQDYIQLFQNISQTNVGTLLFAITALAFLIVIKFVINPRVQKWIKIPLPGELLVVLVATLISYFVNVHERFGVPIVDYIPAKLPHPLIPRFDVMKTIFVDCLMLAVLTYCQAVSQEMLYAKLHSYSIDFKQEFFALGMCNMAGSFFQCFNSGLTVSRSIVCERAGAKSQISGLVGTAVVIITILFIAPYLEPLPTGILAAIIIAACVDLLRQLKELKTLWQISKYDFAIYLITFLAVVFLDVSYGLMLSVLFAFFTAIIRSQRQRVTVMGQLLGTEIYDDMNKYTSLQSTSGVKIVNYDGPLLYANVDKFKTSMLKSTNIEQDHGKKFFTNKITQTRDKIGQLETGLQPISCFILNCGNITYVDVMGAETLKAMYDICKQHNVTLYFTNIHDSVQQILMKTNFHDVVPKENIFVTIYDAVAYLKSKPKRSASAVETSERFQAC